MQGMKLNRELLFERSRVDTQARTVPAALSSEEPILRFFGYEVLDHAPEAVDLSRARPSLPLLLNHDVDSIVGSAESVRVEGGKLRATLRFAETVRGEEVFALVRDGHLRGVSVGYQIDRAEQTGELDGNPIYTVRKWTVLESTLTPIPADTTVGIGRSGGLKKMDITHVDEQGALSRVNEMLEIGEKYAKHGGREIAARAVREGKDAKWLCDELLRGMGTTPSPASSDGWLGMGVGDTRRYSVLRAIRAVADGRPQDAGIEYEADRALRGKLGLESRRGFLVPADIQTRDLSAGTASAGGYLVGTENLGGSFIDLLRARALVLALGATRLPGLRGNVTIPKLSGAGTAYWVTEGNAVTESNQTFGQLALAPKTVGAITEITRQLLLQSDPAAEHLVMDDLSKVVGLAMDSAALNGTGAAGQPLGVLNTSGIGSVSGTSLGWAGIVEFQTDTAASNALGAAGAYVTTPAIAGLMMQRQRFTSTDSPIWSGNVLDGLMGGFKAASTTQIPSGTMLFGDWSQIVIAEWGVLELIVNPYGPNFAAGNILVRALYSVDIGVRQAGAFSLATSIT